MRLSFYGPIDLSLIRERERERKMFLSFVSLRLVALAANVVVVAAALLSCFRWSRNRTFDGRNAASLLLFSFIELPRHVVLVVFVYDTGGTCSDARPMINAL